MQIQFVFNIVKKKLDTYSISSLSLEIVETSNSSRKFQFFYPKKLDSMEETIQGRKLFEETQYLNYKLLLFPSLSKFDDFLSCYYVWSFSSLLLLVQSRL